MRMDLKFEALYLINYVFDSLKGINDDIRINYIPIKY